MVCFDPDWAIDSMLSKVGDGAEISPLGGGIGSCIDWDERRKGIEEGVRRFD